MARDIDTARRTDPREAKARADDRRTPLQTTAAAVGVVFLAVGVLGFVPGITTNFDDLQFAGHESDAELFGIFQVNALHNIVHLLFGVAGLAMATTATLARAFLFGGGIAYLGLWIYGAAIDLDTDWNIVSLNTADNWLHFGLGAGMITLGYAVSNMTKPRTAR